MSDADPTARIAELEARIVALTRSHEIDRAVIAANPVDLDAARAVAHAQISDTDDVSKAVANLKASKPFLFQRTGNSPTPSVMTPAPEPRPAADEARALADEARTGDRGALLAYLRARKGR